MLYPVKYSGRCFFSQFERQILSKAALKAHFVTFSSDNAKADEMILTVHRWFANKSCPGNWMFARMGDLAEKVTVALDGEGDVPSTDVPVPEPVNDPEKTIWLYLIGKIGNAFGVAGLMGNLYAESGLRDNK